VKKYDYVLVDLPNEASPAVFECLLQSDRVFVICKNADDHLTKTRLLLGDLRFRSEAMSPKAKVVLTAVEKTSTPFMADATQKLGERPSYILHWIPESELMQTVDGSPYVLHKPMESYSFVVRRIARELGNMLVGLVLGCGAARGLAHIGVIRVLEREGISVDIVSGSSMGALIAAAWAVGKTADEMEEIALRIKGKRAFFRLLDPMFPGSGIIRGMKVQEFLHSILDDLTFADTVIPLKVVSSDLMTMEQVVHEEGRLIEAVRASVSIPGVFRPVENNGHTLIDGGITDPVPVSALSRSGVAKIIAVNTIPNVDDMKARAQLREELAQASPRERRNMMREVGAIIDTPTSIINIYMRSMHAMQSYMAEQSCKDADVVVRPISRGGVWYDFYHPERYIRCGEEAAEKMVPQLKELVRV
jgi:NTE family protein